MTEEQNQENQRPVLPPCCNSGCTVCVLDYPELFLTQTPEPETIAMLEAIEQAQQLLASPKSESPIEQSFTEEW